MSVVSAGILLFLVMDPFGNIPLFLTALKNVEPGRRRRVVLRELVIALAALLAFLFTGPALLEVLHISEPSLTLAGSIILFLISLKMIFPGTGLHADDGLDGEPFVVPLAIPFVAGPSAMASVLFIMNREPERWPEWLLAVVVAWLLTGTVLYFSTYLQRLLRKRGLIAIERLMGMLLTTIAVQMFMTGVADFFGE